MEAKAGYHVDGEGIVLAPDLCGLRLTMVAMDAAASFPAGEFHLAVMDDVVSDGVTRGAGREVQIPRGIAGKVSAEPVPRDMARRVCQNYMLTGGLCVYTAAKDDARSLASELCTNAKPHEDKVPAAARGHAVGAIGLRGKGKASVRIMYGSGHRS